MLEFGGFTIVPGAVEALGPIRPRHEGGQRVFSFAIHLRGGHTLAAAFPSNEEAEAARKAVVEQMKPQRP
jgi:hypothetical protein